MKCPKCKDKTEVLETSQRGERTHRRRRCLGPHCLHRFTTSEVNNSSALVSVAQSPAPVEDDALQAAMAVDQRRAAIARAQRADRRRDREAWYETGFEPAPELRDESDVMREIKGY